MLNFITMILIARTMKTPCHCTTAGQTEIILQVLPVWFFRTRAPGKSTWQILNRAHTASPIPFLPRGDVLKLPIPKITLPYTKHQRLAVPQMKVYAWEVLSCCREPLAEAP